MSSQDVAISRKHIIGEVPMIVCEIAESCLYTGFFGSIDTTKYNFYTNKF